MSYYLPDDVVGKILLSLPLKSLVRFCCVSKSWNSHITSSDFIHAQLNCTKISTSITGNNLLLLKYNVHKPENVKYSLHLDNDNMDLYRNLNCPFHTVNMEHSITMEHIRVLGSVNGLVCLEVDKRGKLNYFVLWNPSISKHVILPCPQFTFSTHGSFEDAIGFGFDSRNNDYKVVRLFFEDSNLAIPMVEIFKLSTRSWETIVASIDEGYRFQNQGRGPVYLNGAVYWSVYKVHFNIQVILSFDMTNEVFHEILLPPCNCGFRALHVGVYGECLALICYRCAKFCSYDFIVNEIWVMKDGSWTKLYSFDLPGFMGKVIAFLKNGDFLRTVKNGQLVSYDFTTKKSKYFGIFEYNHFHCFGSRFYAGDYEESLVLLGYEKTPGNGTIQARN